MPSEHLAALPVDLRSHLPGGWHWGCCQSPAELPPPSSSARWAEGCSGHQDWGLQGEWVLLGQ